MESVRVPQERIAVLVGKRGVTKRKIEKAAGVKIVIEKDGAVFIESEDSYSEFRAKDVVKAIGRGFSPESALKLLNDEYYLKIIPLKRLFHSEKAIKRMKGRVIGEEGRAKKMIEETSEAEVVVYRSTIGIIGMLDEVELAGEAIGRLLEGKNHSTVFNFLQKAKKKLKEDRMLHMWRKPAKRG